MLLAGMVCREELSLSLFGDWQVDGVERAWGWNSVGEVGKSPAQEGLRVPLRSLALVLQHVSH